MGRDIDAQFAKKRHIFFRPKIIGPPQTLAIEDEVELIGKLISPPLWLSVTERRMDSGLRFTSQCYRPDEAGIQFQSLDSVRAVINIALAINPARDHARSEIEPAGIGAGFGLKCPAAYMLRGKNAL